MVKKMNKQGFIKTLAEQTGMSVAKCTRVNSILEDNFVIGRKHKEVIIAQLQEQLKLDTAAAEQLYETAMGILGTGIKDKLKHPFGAQE